MRVFFMLPSFLPRMLIPMMTGMMVVIILDCVSVMIGKSKGDRCRNSYPACVTAVSIVGYGPRIPEKRNLSKI